MHHRHWSAFSERDAGGLAADQEMLHTAKVDSRLSCGALVRLDNTSDVTLFD
jgi:hypothetical protein